MPISHWLGHGSGYFVQLGKWSVVPTSYVPSKSQCLHCHGRLGHEMECWFKLPRSPTHLHPLHLWGQRTFNSFAFRLKYLSSVTVKLGSLHSGQDFPSRWSLDTTFPDSRCPQHLVCWGSLSSSKVTGQKYSRGGSSTKSYSIWTGSGAWTSVDTPGGADG